MSRHPHRTVIDLEEVRAHHRTATAARTPVALWIAAADVPVLLAEIDRVRTLHALTRAHYADLLAAARATLAAHRDGEADPLFYLRDELAARGQLPPRHLHALELLALAVTLDGPGKLDGSGTLDGDGR
ncbi:MAG TPA: hypothetical protein VLJ59_16860 [Mycobacteriales bacterium]|nr:hypothetical protein [Mycobacteriales bacterium]